MLPSVGLYARVSTSDKGQDTENQFQPLREYVARQGWPVYGEYSDDISAVKHRPSFEKLIADAEAGLFNTIVVWKIDRLSRSVKDFILTTIRLDKKGIRLIVTSQGLDTDVSNPGSRLMMNILISFAEFERDLIKDRVKAGIARRKREGKPVGRQKRILPLGVIESMLAEGLSAREIARILKEPSATIIRRVALITKRLAEPPLQLKSD